MKLFLSIALTAATLATAAHAAPATGTRSFDGPWSVTLVTESGLCESTSSHTLAVKRGAVSLVPAPGQRPLTLSGQVSRGGGVDVVIASGSARAQVGGRLNQASGGGSWTLPLLGCSGRWTASRQAPARTASY